MYHFRLRKFSENGWFYLVKLAFCLKIIVLLSKTFDFLDLRSENCIPPKQDHIFYKIVFFSPFLCQTSGKKTYRFLYFESFFFEGSCTYAQTFWNAATNFFLCLLVESKKCLNYSTDYCTCPDFVASCCRCEKKPEMTIFFEQKWLRKCFFILILHF